MKPFVVYQICIILIGLYIIFFDVLHLAESLLKQHGWPGWILLVIALVVGAFVTHTCEKGR